MTSNIELSIKGLETVLASEGFIHSRRAFVPVFNISTSGKLFLDRDKVAGGAVWEDAKKGGNVLARFTGDLLLFERIGLSDGQVEEVVVVAVALAEAVRRAKRDQVVADLAEGIGDFSAGGADGSGGGE